MAKKQSRDALGHRAVGRERKSVITRKVDSPAANCHDPSSRRSAGVAINPGMLPKLSEVLLDYAIPLMETVDRCMDRKIVISIAILCWNMSLLPVDVAQAKCGPFVDELLKGEEALKRDMDSIFATMCRRKELLYSHDKRFIIDYSLTEMDDVIYLRVASSPMAG